MADETQTSQQASPTASQPAPRPSGPRRRWLAPEVVQTSAMDCGPAALKCLLEGFGVPVSYGRLREACQTSVDGTSIDTLEHVAGLLGLDAEQIMLPVEHVIAPGSDALPAIAVVRLPSGATHFVVLWRRVGSYVQVMDPARGRRWVRVSVMLRDLYLHTQAVDAEAFREFAADSGFSGPLAWRLRRLVGSARVKALEPLIVEAAADPSWRSMARLDAAVRATESLIAAGALRRGAEVENLLRTLAAANPDPSLDGVLGIHATARAAPTAVGPAATEQVLLRGTVLVRIAGRRARDENSPREALPVDLAAALGEVRTPLWRTLVALWTPRAKKTSLVLGVLALLVAAGTIWEVVLARPLLSFDGDKAGAGAGMARALLVLCAVVWGLFAFELPLAIGTRALGRALDQGLRQAFLRKLPRLGDRYFSSRPVSDMAERAHLLHRVRLLPGLAAQLGRTVFELLLMTVAIVWLYPRGAPIALALLVVVFLIPLLAVPVLVERDLRLRTHSGSLMRFYLDALLGLSAVRTHGAERAVVREHDVRLVEWRRAGRDMMSASRSIESVVLLVSALGAGALVMGSFDGAGGGSGAAVTGTALTASGTATGFLLLFFALGLPGQAAKLIALWRQLPEHRNLTLRLIEPLGAPEEHATFDDQSAPLTEQTRAAEGAASPAGVGAAAIAVHQVSVEAGGHALLTDVSVEIPPAAHVAIVGPSGAGKSTLLGLLLGFHRPVAGSVLVDGGPLNEPTTNLAILRAATVWVEPGIQIWNASLRDNLAYGSDPAPSPRELSRALDDAELANLVSRLPEGIDTRLGEGGGLLSGGEGQRVRLARELIRVRHPRLVLLDEPFRGLDRETRRRLLTRARARWAGATLLTVTHDIEHTTDFSRVLVIDGGRIVESGDPVALAADPGSRYRRLLDADARVRARRWSNSLWRRLVVRDGRVAGSTR